MDQKPFDPTKPQSPQTPLGTDFITTGGSTQLSDDERTKAMLAHLGVFVPILVPFLILQANGKESAFIRAHATEALNFQITMMIPVLLGLVFTAITFGLGGCMAIPAIALVAVFAVVMSVVAALKAKDGVAYRYPLTIRMVK